MYTEYKYWAAEKHIKLIFVEFFELFFLLRMRKVIISDLLQTCEYFNTDIQYHSADQNNIAFWLLNITARSELYMGTVSTEICVWAGAVY